MELVEAALARGLRDLLPGEMIARQSMIATIQRVYELYGFVPISTPAIAPSRALGLGRIGGFGLDFPRPGSGR